VTRYCVEVHRVTGAVAVEQTAHDACTIT